MTKIQVETVLAELPMVLAPCVLPPSHQYIMVRQFTATCVHAITVYKMSQFNADCLSTFVNKLLTTPTSVATKIVDITSFILAASKCHAV